MNQCLPEPYYLTRTVAATVLLLIIWLLPVKAFAQQDPGYDEISISLNVQRLGNAEIAAVIRGGEAYLPVTELFDFLQVKNSRSASADSITGFYMDPKSAYIIDGVNNRIILEEKTFSLSENDIIKTASNLYLKSNYFGEVFGLSCAFSFRDLSIKLTTVLELPVIKEMRLEQLRKNASLLKNEVKPDSAIGRKYPLFHFGMADWSVMSTQEVKGITDTRLNLVLGGMFAGGETNVSLNYSSGLPFSERQQNYSWRYVNNDHHFLRQVTAGKIFPQSISSVFSPVVGVKFTNTPTTYRRSFGTYRLSNTTEPGWMVELYVNNILVNYMKTDASGFYSFDVPLVYGNSAVTLRFYGPWGEEKIREENISVPFSFLPAGEMEYAVTAGIVQDGQNSRFTRSVVNYGLNKRMTIGAGVEYLSSISTGKTLPFLTASMRLASSLLFSGEFTYGVRSKGVLTYRHRSNLLVELNYTRYTRGQAAVRFNFTEEKKASVSLPFRNRWLNAFTRLTVTQDKMPKLNYTAAEFLFSGAFAGMSANLTSRSIWSGNSRHPYIYSNLSLTYRLPGSILLIPQIQYDHNLKKVAMLKGELQANLFRNAYANLSYEKNFSSNIHFFMAGIRFDLAFAHASFSAVKSNRKTNFVQTARGSLMYDDKAKFLGFNNRSSVGKGGIILRPYLDLNCNGLRESNEPDVFKLNFKINGGTAKSNEQDGSVWVTNLEAYANYMIGLDDDGFDNVAWKIKNKVLQVVADPNQFKTVEVPVAVLGEVSGMITLKGKDGSSGLSRIIVHIYNQDSVLVGRAVSESDGYFSFLGLAPGKYTASLDEKQMKKLHLHASPAKFPFTILRKKDGDVVDGLIFEVE
jgi:hypothetical protein